MIKYIEWGVISQDFFNPPLVLFSVPPVLKVDQTSLLKFPVSPLSSSLCSTLGAPLLPVSPGLQVGAASHHLPLDLHLRGKLEHGSDGGIKSKKGRRSRTVFTELQLMGLEKRFEKQKYLSTPDRWAHSENTEQSPLQMWAAAGSETKDPQ